MYTQNSLINMLAVGGKSNSLGRAAEVVELVLQDKSRLGELFEFMNHDDAWLRMRAIDSIEKVCRIHPEWFEQYTPLLFTELTKHDQPSIQWHLAQMSTQIKLSDADKNQVVSWLEGLLKNVTLDWIVAANAMDALMHFVKKGEYSTQELISLLRIQQNHHSKSVVKRAAKLLSMIDKF